MAQILHSFEEQFTRNKQILQGELQKYRKIQIPALKTRTLNNCKATLARCRKICDDLMISSRDKLDMKQFTNRIAKIQYTYTLLSKRVMAIDNQHLQQVGARLFQTKKPSEAATISGNNLLLQGCIADTGQIKTKMDNTLFELHKQDQIIKQANKDAQDMSSQLDRTNRLIRLLKNRQVMGKAILGLLAVFLLLGDVVLALIKFL